MLFIILRLHRNIQIHEKDSFRPEIYVNEKKCYFGVKKILFCRLFYVVNVLPETKLFQLGSGSIVLINFEKSETKLVKIYGPDPPPGSVHFAAYRGCVVGHFLFLRPW